MMEYQSIRSDRKTLSIEVRGTQVIVRAPGRISQQRIDSFVAEHETWMKKKIAKNVEESRKADQAGILSEEELKALYRKAKEVIPQRTAYYAEKIGVTYGKITIRCQKTKWGSCSAKGNLNFNCLLMMAPPEVLDSIVVHELCHRREMNHSRRFYEEIYRVFPDYARWNKWLKENGGVLMARIPG